MRKTKIIARPIYCSTHCIMGMALLALLLSQPALAQEAPKGFNKAWKQITNTLKEDFDTYQVHGGALYVMHQGQVMASEHVGMADDSLGQPIDENTIYHWASITKTFTGIAIMQLRDRGLLSLDDKIVDYLPELKQVHNPYGPMEAITLRHLMSHSAGFRAGTWPLQYKPWHPHEPTQWSQLAALMPYTEIQFEPGSQFSYSNPGIIFLAQVVEQLSGDDIEVYLTKNILMPLGMARSYFDITPYHLQAHRSNSYYVVNDTLTVAGRDFDTGITTSNGGLNAPIPDMIRYTNFLLGVQDNGNYAHVLSRKSLEEMWAPVHPARTRNEFQEHIGLVFYSMALTGEEYAHMGPIVGHTGSQHGFESFMFIDPATHSATLLAMNTLSYTTDGDSFEFGSGWAFAHARNGIFQKIFPLFLKE